MPSMWDLNTIIMFRFVYYVKLKLKPLLKCQQQSGIPQ